MDSQIPKAWLPAHRFTLESELKFENLLEDLCQLGKPFTLRLWEMGDAQYQHAIDAEIRPSASYEGAAEIILLISKRYQSRAQVSELESRNFSRSAPTSPVWKRIMRGKPSSRVLANHALAGIKFAIDFKPNSGFVVKSEVNQVQKALDEILVKHQTWTTPSSGELRFLNP
jgi:hypothetical protein